MGRKYCKVTAPSLTNNCSSYPSLTSTFIDKHLIRSSWCQ